MREITVSVFFDFTKAFDCVDHRLLVVKLKDLGFSLFSSQMDMFPPRQQKASRSRSSLWYGVGGEIRDSWCSSGISPGPLLFSLYLLHLYFGNILKHCKFNFYADDLLIYLHVRPDKLRDAVQDQRRHRSLIGRQRVNSS